MNTPTNSALPFRTGWWSFDLGRYRPCDSTYCFWPAASLPPLRPLDGSVLWLGPLDSSAAPAPAQRTVEARRHVADVQAQATRLGLRLPDAYTRLLGEPALQDRIPSCTACEFTFPDAIVPCPNSEQGYLIRFLDDQQWVLLWYLYLTPGGDERVLCMPPDLEQMPEWNDGEGPTGEELAQVVASITEVAPSFEAFIYRFWLENRLWYRLNERGAGELTAEEQAYLAHYERAGGSAPEA